jgi:hypothetical protein
MNEHLICDECGSHYFQIAAKYFTNATQVANSTALKCANCNALYNVVDGELAPQDPRK